MSLYNKQDADMMSLWVMYGKWWYLVHCSILLTSVDYCVDPKNCTYIADLREAFRNTNNHKFYI